MEGLELKQGKDRVQTLLLDRLELIGMKRGKNMTLPKQEEMYERLRGKLAYMPSEFLQALANAIRCNARGILRNTWPSEITLLNWARDLLKPPASDSKLVRTFVQSVGERALSEGHLTELYLYLKTFGHPPSGDGWRLIRRRAQENASRAIRAIERDDQDELKWLAIHNQSAARALELLHLKEQKAAAE